MKVFTMYEGWDKDQQRRSTLVGKTMLAGMEPSRLFHEKREALIEKKYDVDEIQQRILNGDGGSWIKETYDPDAIFQLDRYHVYQEILRKINDRSAQREARNLFEEGKTPLFVMLDGITDVRNFGAIARTCECAGADAIIIPSKNSVSVNADAMKTSAGALHTLPVCREQNLTNTIKYLKDCGFKIVAATEKGDYDYTKANYKDPVCIIMGAEDTGVPYEHLSLCDEWIKIPLMGKIESLNVSVAAGILIYEAVKQRGFTEDKTASAL